MYYWYQPKQEILTFSFDKEDLDRVKTKYWEIQGTYHLATRMGGKRIWLHNFILDYCDDSKKTVVDHIDRNPLNNCKSNLRIVSSQRNQWNREKETSTGIRQRNNKWRVTGSRKLHQECLVDSYEEALQKRQEYVSEIEKYLDDLDKKLIK